MSESFDIQANRRRGQRSQRIMHVLVPLVVLATVAFGWYMVNDQSRALKRSSTATYQQTELEIVRAAARSVSHDLSHAIEDGHAFDGEMEHDLLDRYVAPISLLENGRAWVYAYGGVIFNLDVVFPGAAPDRNMADMFAQQVDRGANNYASLVAGVMAAGEGTSWYVWDPDMGRVIVAWTPVDVNNNTWVIGLSTPLRDILDANGARESVRVSSNLMIVASGLSLAFVILWLFSARRQLRLSRLRDEVEQRYQAVSELTSDYAYSYRIEPDGSYIPEWTTHSATRITGLPVEELALPTARTDLIHPDDRAISQARQQRMLAGEPDVSEIRIITPDGKTRWIRSYGRPIVDPKTGRVIRVYGATQDITERRLAEEALRASEAKYRHLVNSVQSPVLAVDEAMTILYCNVAYARFVDRRIADLEGINLLDAFPVFARTKSYAAFQHVLASGETAQVEDVTPNGRYMRARVYRTPNGILSITEDITEQKRAQESERRQRVLAEALRDTITALVSTLDTEAILGRMLEGVARVVPYDAANIMLFDYENETASVAEHTGYKGRGLPIDMDSHTVSFDEYGYFFRHHKIWEGEPLIIEDTQTSPEWVQHSSNTWIRSFACVPIRLDNQVIGVMNLDSGTVGNFTQGHLELLRAFADQTAIAIRNARLFAAERRQRLLAEALRDTAAALNSTLDQEEVFDRILSNLGQVVPYEAANIMLIERMRTRTVRSRGYDAYNAAQVANEISFDITTTQNMLHSVETCQPGVISDTRQDAGWVNVEGLEWIRSHISVPIQHEDKIIGLLNVDSSEPGFFSAAQAESLHAFAHHAAVAIVNARLHDQLQKQAIRLAEEVMEQIAEIRRQQEQADAVLHNISDAIMLLGPEGHITYVNQAFTTLIGYEPEECIGRPHMDVLQANAPVPAVIEDKIDTVSRHRTWYGEMVVLDKQGTPVEVEIAIVPVFGLDGKLESLVGSIRDIAHFKQLDRMKTRFMQLVSHELRTPLSSIQLYTELLAANKAPEKQAAYISTLQDETKRLIRLTEKVIDVTRMTQPDAADQWVSFAPDELLQGALAYFDNSAHTAEVTLSATPPAGTTRHVRGNRALLARALHELVENAIAFTPAGGSVTLSVVVNEADDEVGLAVRDTGTGIKDDDVQRIMADMFYRGDLEQSGHIPGIGLGLTITRVILERHDGYLTVANAEPPDVGCTFTIWLPAYSPA